MMFEAFGLEFCVWLKFLGRFRVQFWALSLLKGSGASQVDTSMVKVQAIKGAALPCRVTQGFRNCLRQHYKHLNRILGCGFRYIGIKVLGVCDSCHQPYFEGPC